MNKLFFYIFFSANKYILFNILFITTLLIFINLLEISRLIAYQNTDVLTFLFLSFLKIPSVISETIPFVIVISIAFLFRNLISNNELISMRNMGLSIIDIYKPISASIFFYGFLILIFINPLSAKFEKKFESLTTKNLSENYSIRLSDEGMWIKNISNEINKKYINTTSFDIKNMTAKNIKILDINNENNKNILIIAENGSIENELFKLNSVKIIDINNNEIMKLDKYKLKVNFNQNNIRDSISNYKFIPYYKYWDHIKSLKKFNLYSSEISLYYLSELLKPLFLVVIGFVVMGFSGKFRRNENFFKILFISILIGFLFFLLKELMITITTNLNLPFIFSYIVIFSLPFFIGLYQTMKIEND
jgi:lipopolysaccharide export system permease protein